MKNQVSPPLYSWMIEQYKGFLPLKNDYEEMKRVAREFYLSQAPLLLRKTGQKRPPFDPFLAARQRRINRLTWVDSGDEASLIPDENGFHLILRNPNKPTDQSEIRNDVRVRSTVAHEVGHTFFFDISFSPPREGPRLERKIAQKTRNKEEHWCYDFARQLLLPDRHVRKSISSCNRSGLELAVKLRRDYNVSWDFLFRKLVHDLGVWSNSTVFRFDIERMPSALQSEPKNVWRGAKSKIANTRKWLLENNDFLNRCIHQVEKTGEDKTIKFLNPQRRYVAEFLRIYKDRRVFLCLVDSNVGILDEYMNEEPSNDK